MGGNGVILGVQRDWLSGFSSLYGHGDSLRAELLALRDGIEYSWRLGYKHLQCEVYCLEVFEHISDINNQAVDLHLLKDVIYDIGDLLQFSWEVIFKHDRTTYCEWCSRYPSWWMSVFARLYGVYSSSAFCFICFCA